MFLVEQLERRVADGRKLPLSNNVVIDGPAALDLIDQLRVSVPEEVRQAKRTNADAERILEKAQDEADDIVARAQEHAAFLIEERELTRAAEVKSEEIITEAHSQADEIRHGAEEYAASVLVKLEGEVVRLLQAIRRGISMLDERTAAGPDDGTLADDEARAAPSNAEL